MHPASPVHAALPTPLLRHCGLGVSMAVVTIAIGYGARRSGAHINPVMTLASLRRGKISRPDAAWYIVFQFAGGLVAPPMALALIGDRFQHPTVKMAASMPGPMGPGVAFAAEFAITLLLTLVVLAFADSKRMRSWSAIATGLLIGVYIAFESPLSGMSMNPARTFGSAVASGHWNGLWIYFTAPLAGAMTALAGYLALAGKGWGPDFEEGPSYPLQPEPEAP